MFKPAFFSSLALVTALAGAADLSQLSQVPGVGAPAKGPLKPHKKRSASSSFVALPAKAAAPVIVVPKVTYTKLVTEARRLYESGKYPAAAQAYERIPADSTEFLRTREELAWTYLRQENWIKLRGLLPDLNSKLVPLRWRLEGRVLSAMLYLKDCEYERVRAEVELFQDELQPMARVVDRRLNGSVRPSYWRALHAEMDEAIFKMKFVRMELRSRLVMLTRQQVIDTPDRQDVHERIASGKQVYPVNGDVWVDEIFLKRGEGKSVCASLHNRKVLQ